VHRRIRALEKQERVVQRGQPVVAVARQAHLHV
jgi:hypothetical protein